MTKKYTIAELLAAAKSYAMEAAEVILMDPLADKNDTKSVILGALTTMGECVIHPECAQEKVGYLLMLSTRAVKEAVIYGVNMMITEAERMPTTVRRWQAARDNTGEEVVVFDTATGIVEAVIQYRHVLAALLYYREQTKDVPEERVKWDVMINIFKLAQKKYDESVVLNARSVLIYVAQTTQVIAELDEQWPMGPAWVSWPTWLNQEELAKQTFDQKLGA